MLEGFIIIGVSSKLKRMLRRRVKRMLRNKRVLLFTGVGLLSLALIGYTDYMQHRRLSVDPTTYTPLLSVIAKAESKGNYNAYFGNASNSSIDFTRMTIAQVLQWQADFVRQGNPSSAVGKYQIINTTLAGLVHQLGIDTNKQFDQATQDKLAVALLERRGAEKYVNKEISSQEFAANIAKEWAGLPKVIGPNPEKSYYASDGLNKSRVDVDEVMKAIEPIKAK